MVCSWVCCFSSPPFQLTEKMFNNSVYRKILRLMGRGRDSPNKKKEPEDEYGSVPEHLRGKTFEFPYQRKIVFALSTVMDFLLFQFVAPDKLLVKKDECVIRNGANVFKELVKSTHGKNNPFRIFSLKELQKATNNFSANLTLWDSFPSTGTPTYRGTIEDRHVVVRIPRFRDTLLNEVVSLSLIKHRNVVKLLGSCLETEDPILVHEFPPNGTLEQNIFHENHLPPRVELLWTDKLRIATEIAEAVAYLHSELHMTHGCLWTAEAIVLDEFHSAKLCAFEYSKIQNQAESSDVETNNIRNKFRKRNDVSDFGNILLNLLCIKTNERSILAKCKEKVKILKYLKLKVSKKEMPQMEAYIDLMLRCQSSLAELWNMLSFNQSYPRMKEELSMEKVARELRRIRSMINQQPTDGNELDNLSSGENAFSSNNDIY